jgi:hypothetical protein
MDVTTWCNGTQNPGRWTPSEQSNSFVIEKSQHIDRNTGDLKDEEKKWEDHFLDGIIDANIRLALPSVEKSPRFSPLEDARKISKSLSGRISPIRSASWMLPSDWGQKASASVTFSASHYFLMAHGLWTATLCLTAWSKNSRRGLYLSRRGVPCMKVLRFSIVPLFW